jgi:hypothetical protein
MHQLAVAVLATLCIGLAGCGGSTAPPASCAGIPTHVPGDPFPAFSPDPALAPVFPDFGGDIAPAIEFARWLDTACFMGNEAAVQAWVAHLPAVNFNTLTVATFRHMPDDGTFTLITIYALRSPGQDAGPLLPSFLDLVGGMGGSLPGQFPPSQSNVSIAGRNVTIWNNTTLDKLTYAFVSGDTVYALDPATDELAARVFPLFH